MKKKFLFSVICFFVFSCCLIVEAQPANPAFEDDSFYRCVVDSYNKDTGGKLSYDVNLNDEQLLAVKNLDCPHYSNSDSGYTITNVSGIEKLSNVVKVELLGQQIFTINLSNLKSLSSLDLTHNEVLSSLNVSANSNLIALTLGGSGSGQRCALTTVDLSNNTKLQKVSITDCNLETIDLTHNPDLKVLSLSDNQLSSIDLINNMKLEEIRIGWNKLNNLNLEKQLNLKHLHIDYTENLDNLNLQNNPLLKYLDASKCNLSKIDLSKNGNLKDIKLNGNQLTQLVLPKGNSIHSLQVQNNFLSYLDLEDQLNIEVLNIDKNKIPFIDLAKMSNLKQSGGVSMYGQIGVKSVIGKQNVEVPLYRYKGKYVLDILSLNKQIDLTKIKIEKQEGVKYDLAKGIIIFAKPIEEYSYVYETGWQENVQVKVKLILTEEEYKEQDVPKKEQVEVIENVPDTEKNRSFIMIFIAVMLLFLGVGIFYIQLGRKKQE